MDLVITNEENNDIKLEYRSPIGKSDHSMLLIETKCSYDGRKRKGNRKNYNKANYERIREDLAEVAWGTLLGGGSVEQQWSCFDNKKPD